MQFPLAREELESIRAIKEKFDGARTGYFSPQEAQMWQDMLQLMESKGLIKHCTDLDGVKCILFGDLDIFESWVKQENKKAEKISRREWKIAIVSAVVGAVVGAVLSALFK